MKKSISILLILVMLFGLCTLVGCGQTAEEAQTQTQTETETTEEAVAEQVEETDQEDADSAEEATTSYDTSDWEAITLNVSTSNNETDYASECLSWFANEVETRSDGKIKFEIFWGGTYCAMAEEYDYVSSGALDMILWNQSFNSDAFPILAMSLLNVGSNEALDMVNYLCYENTDTASIFEDVTHGGNVECLGFIPAGYSGFYATTPITTWSDFSDITFGTMLNASLWTAMGMNVVSCSPADMYESLSRGVIDSCGQALSAAISRMFYEVAEYGLVAGYSAVAYNFTINLDRWNSLNDDQQALFRECMAELDTYSRELYDETEEEMFDTWETESGHELAIMSDEDSWEYMYTAYPISYETYLTSAENLGQTEQFETWVDATSDYLGFDVRTGEHE